MSPADLAIIDAVNAELEAIDIAQCRAKVVDTWIAGWITGDHAMQTLVEMGLIEHNPELVNLTQT
jgi:hypothetical protein